MAVKNIFLFYWFVSQNDPELAERLSKLNLPKRQGWKQMHHAVVCMLSMYTCWFYRQIIKESFDQEQTFWQIIPVKGFILISESVFHIWLRKRKPSAESNRDYHERDHDLPPVICQDFDFSCIQERRLNRLFFLCRICLIATMIRPFFFFNCCVVNDTVQILPLDFSLKKGSRAQLLT